MNKAIMNNVASGRFEEQRYSADEKKKIVDYMRSVEPIAVAGLVRDCVSNKDLTEENLVFTDGVFVWNSQDVYHIEKYNAAVTSEFYSMLTN